jgi:hypothetical protein
MTKVKNLKKEKDEVLLDEDDSDRAEETKGNVTEINIMDELSRLSEGVNKFKDAVVKFKGAEIKKKDWTFSISRSEEEYNVDFKLQMSIQPKKT